MPLAQTLRWIINKWDLLNLRILCKANNIINETKVQPTDWEKTFKTLLITEAQSKILYKELKKMVTKTPNNPIKNDVQIKIENCQQRNGKWSKVT